MNQTAAIRAAIGRALHAPTMAERREAARRALWEAVHDVAEAQRRLELATAIYRRLHGLPDGVTDAEVLAWADRAPWEQVT